MKKVLIITTVFCFLIISSALAAPIDWTSWTFVTSGATGTVVQNGTTVGVTYAGATIGDLSNWGEGTPAPYTGSAIIDNAPTSGISFDAASTGHTLTFSQALIDPVFALYSVGRTYLPVDYVFDQPFTLLSQGVGAWGGTASGISISGNTLTGREGNGVIQFIGNISSITWDTTPAEYHHGFTLGVLAEAVPHSDPVPEPSTILLLGSGLLGLGWYGRKRKKS